MSKTTTQATWTTKFNLAATVTLTLRPCRPCGVWEWDGVVRLNGRTAAYLRVWSDGRFGVEFGFVPEEEHAALTNAIRDAAHAAETAYFGAATI